MNILILNGSPRKNGHTAKKLAEISSRYKEEHTCETINVYDLHFAPCKSCYGCRPNKCCILPPDDATQIWHKIQKADMLIIGSPTYYGNMSGMLKLLFDRLLTAFEYMDADGLQPPHPASHGRKAIIMATCNTPHPYCNDISQAAGTLGALANVLHSGGFDIIEKHIIPSH